MHFHPFLAPYKVAVLPLMKKFHTEKAEELYRNLSNEFMCYYDDAGNIGKRYRRADIMGIPFAITIDDNSLNEGTVTIRNRDTMKQDIVKLEDITNYINEKIRF